MNQRWLTVKQKKEVGTEGLLEDQGAQTAPLPSIKRCLFLSSTLFNSSFEALQEQQVGNCAH